MKFQKTAINICIFLSVFSFIHGSVEDDVMRTFTLLKQGYETKNIDILARCFTRLKPQQREAYEQIFSLTDDYDVDIDIKKISFGNDYLARVDAELTYDFVVKIGEFKKREKKEKELSYLMFKKDSRWCIMGAKEEAAVSKLLHLKPDNVEEINELLQQLPADIREKILSSTMAISKANPEFTWKGDTDAAYYVISVTSDDITKVENTQMFYKKENHPIPHIILPADTFTHMKVGNTYYLNVFSYNADGEDISGSIFPFTLME